MAAPADRYTTDVGKSLRDQELRASDHIVELAAAAVLDVEIAKTLAVAAAAAVVGLQHDEPFLRQEEGPGIESEHVLPSGPP
jgi:hypothetical protein